MVTAITNIGDLASIIAAMPSDGPLPTRTVIVRSEAVAHVVRRELATSERAHALVGTRFTDLGSLAAQVLADADVVYTPGEERLRPARVRAALRSAKLGYFAGVRGINGWDSAFARTINDLESAALIPADVAREPDARAQDVAAVWQAVEDAAGTSWTRARVLGEAAALLDYDATRWPEQGLTVVVLDGHETHAEAAIVGRIPRSRLVMFVAKPVRKAYLERIALLFGDAAEQRVLEAAGHPVIEGPTERAVLAAYAFEPPHVLAASERPRSQGRDGSVELEEHAGIDDEVAAAVDWVAREVVEQKTALEDMAIVVPNLDPWAALLVARLASLPWADDDVPVHVIGGLPLAAEAAGARLAALFRLLRSHLHIDALIDVLPSLRLADDARVGRGAAVEILSTLGTIGGTAASPRDALEWRTNLERQRVKLRSVVAEEGSDERGDRERRNRRLATLDRVAPAIHDLSGVVESVVAKAPLATIWSRLRALIEARLPLPGEAGRVAVASLDGLVAQASGSAIAGDDAIVWLDERLASLRTRVGRFGEPRITIATVAQAATLRFRAVRVVGLAEGVLPRNARENPVLSDGMRAAWPELRRAHERTLEELQSLSRLLVGTRDRIVLSHARMDLGGTYREASPVFVEAAAAIGRSTNTFPSTRELERDYFEPARGVRTLPLRGASLLRLGASARVPASWRRIDVCDPIRVQSLARRMRRTLPVLSLDPARVPGLTAARPTSASQLATLLACGHRFLLERILGLRAAPVRASDGAIDTLAYGDLFHRTAEAFYRAHGDAFTARNDTLDAWIARADTMLDRIFDEFLEMYPLKGSAVRGAQRARLRRDVHALLEHDWEGSERTAFVAVERGFGALELPTAEGSLFVRGFIDRLDMVAGATRVWDLKSGRPHPRKDDEYDVSLDVQIALYTRVVQKLAGEWGLPSRVHAAYVYPSGQSKRERAFDGADVDRLLEHLDEWLATARAMLATHTFPRTTNRDDCEWCAFKMVCGTSAAKASASMLADASGAALRFRDLKGTRA